MVAPVCPVAPLNPLFPLGPVGPVGQILPLRTFLTLQHVQVPFLYLSKRFCLKGYTLRAPTTVFLLTSFFKNWFTYVFFYYYSHYVLFYFTNFFKVIYNMTFVHLDIGILKVKMLCLLVVINVNALN